MVAIIIIIPLYKRSIKKKRIERSRVRKSVMFSLLKEYNVSYWKMKFHERTKQRSTTVNKSKDNRNRTSN